MGSESADLTDAFTSVEMSLTGKISEQNLVTHIGNIFLIIDPVCGNSTATGEFPSQMRMTQSFDVFFDLRLNKRLSKQSWGWWFVMPSRPLWGHC